MEPTDKPELVLPNADELNMQTFEWSLVTPDNSQDKFNTLQTQGNSLVFFGLTSQGYEALSNNFSAIRTYIQQQQAIINAYAEYYKENEND